MKKKYLKSLAKKWAELVTALGAQSDKTLPFYDNGEEMHEAALAEIKRLKKEASKSSANAKHETRDE